MVFKKNFLTQLVLLLFGIWVAFCQHVLANENFALCQNLSQQQTEKDSIPQLPFTAQHEGQFAFEEKKYLKNLKKPIISQGILIYRPPHFLEKTVQSPFNARYVMNDKILMQQIGDKKRRKLHVDDHPAISIFVTSLQSILNGDIQQLMAGFDIFQTTLSNQHWFVCLSPKDKTIKKHIKFLAIEGKNSAANLIYWYNNADEYTAMTITDLP